MHIHANSDSTTLILKRGEELIAVLNGYASTKNLAGAWLQAGIGGAGSATLAYYDLEARRYVDRTFDEPLEILSLQGNLAWVDGEPFWHIHGTFGTKEYQSIGGHVKHLDIALTSELLIMPMPTRLTRSYDETTGLKLIDPA